MATLKVLADAIRTRFSVSDTMTVSEMTSLINNQTKPSPSSDFYKLIDRKIETYTIPSSVTSIGGRAFSYCTSLTSVTIPSSVTSIGGRAFSYCTSLTSVTIPSSVTSIGGYAFYYCTGLTSVTIPSSVTSIGDSAFMDCTNLTSVTIPSSVTSIGGNAFYAMPSGSHIYCGFAEGAVSGAPWGAANATIHYNS